jgi:hypothetical protein
MSQTQTYSCMPPCQGVVLYTTQQAHSHLFPLIFVFLTGRGSALLFSVKDRARRGILVIRRTLRCFLGYCHGGENRLHTTNAAGNISKPTIPQKAFMDIRAKAPFFCFRDCSAGLALGRRTPHVPYRTDSLKLCACNTSQLGCKQTCSQRSSLLLVLHLIPSLMLTYR